jgi:hypothetical protein
MDRKDFQTLSRVRLTEARSLLQSGLGDGAYYLAGYSVECAFKACIAKATFRHEFPDKIKVDKSYSHRLKDLLSIAGLDKELEEASPGVRKNWDTVVGWSEQSRYRRKSIEEGAALIAAVGGKDGVVPWIKLFW